MFHNIWDNPSHWLIFFKIVNITSTSYRLNLHTAAISAVDHIGLTDWPVQEFTAFGWILFWIRGTFNNESTMTPGKCKTSLFFSWDSSWDFLGCFFSDFGRFFLCCRQSKIPDDQWPCWPGTAWGRRYQSHIFLAYVSGLFFRGYTPHVRMMAGHSWRRDSPGGSGQGGPTLQHLVGAIMEGPVIVGYFINVF